MKEDANAPASPAVTFPASKGRAYRTYVLLLLTAVYTFNFIDRQIIAILSPAIKTDLGLADWQLGVLKGFAFAVLYTTLGIPIARLADRTNRVNIIAIALALWSGFTALSGACQNFVQLALARVGVGIGEAGGSPPAHSLISDYYPKEKRAGALGVYAMGIPVGVAFAYLAGGWITQTFSWRIAFLVVGLPGIILAILLKLTVREPPRGATEGAGAADAAENSGARSLLSEIGVIWQTAKHLLSIPTYRAVVFGTTAISFSAYANGTWIVDFYARSHSDFSLLTVLFALGLISGTAYALGTFLGGYLVDTLGNKNKRMYGYVPAIALFVNAPLFLISLWHPSAIVSLIFQIPVQLSIGFYLGPAFALAQTLAPVRVRALSTAIFFFILNMIALGFGPTTAGILSSSLSGGMGEELALRWSLTLVSLAGLIGAWYFYLVAKRIPADWENATGEKVE
ncbi:spinster family MFS transporter [Hyphococcus sp.]|uniref:spinster family MFS transporter n=1 Tax=Hyphococcus sp. TaxID=2038636 RepID=UPI003D14C53C